MDCSLQGSSVYGIFQTILEWVAISFSRGSSQPRDQTRVSFIVSRRFYHLNHQGSQGVKAPLLWYYHWFPLLCQLAFVLSIKMLLCWVHAAAAAKLLQLCLTLCNPIDRSPLGSSVPGILQARILEWVAISFSNAWKWKVKSESEVAQSWPTLSNPMDCSLPGSSVHGIFQARLLEWVAIAFSSVGYINMHNCFIFSDLSLDHYLMSFLISCNSLYYKVYFFWCDYFYSSFLLISIAWTMFFHAPTFSLYISLGLKLVSCREHIYLSCFGIHSATLCLLVGIFSPFTFKVQKQKVLNEVARIHGKVVQKRS